MDDERGADLAVLDEIQRRVLWLSTRVVDAANRERQTGDGVKVGGHQASSASLVTAMTAQWFAHLDAAVKPHASPVFHPSSTCSATSTART
jgi:pyruvate dehydrogenase E1 component